MQGPFRGLTRNQAWYNTVLDEVAALTDLTQASIRQVLKRHGSSDEQKVKLLHKFFALKRRFHAIEDAILLDFIAREPYASVQTLIKNINRSIAQQTSGLVEQDSLVARPILTHPDFPKRYATPIVIDTVKRGGAKSPRNFKLDALSRQFPAINRQILADFIQSKPDTDLDILTAMISSLQINETKPATGGGGHSKRSDR